MRVRKAAPRFSRGSGTETSSPAEDLATLAGLGRYADEDEERKAGWTTLRERFAKSLVEQDPNLILSSSPCSSFSE
jgi:hypothetical protein